VVNSVTNAGIPDVTVSLMQQERDVSVNLMQQGHILDSATTDAQGRFQIEHVKAVAYTAMYGSAVLFSFPTGCFLRAR
jgi:hypothetical protein